MTVGVFSCRIMYRELKDSDKEKESGKMVSLCGGWGWSRHFRMFNVCSPSACRTSLSTLLEVVLEV